MLIGKCECGRVQFKVEGEIQELSHCHCSQCRHLHGAAFATFATVRRDEFTIVSGPEEISTYQSSPAVTRCFCGHCGSTMYADAGVRDPFVYLSMSALEGNPCSPAPYHEFVGSKAPWHAILDDAPQYHKAKP